MWHASECEPKSFSNPNNKPVPEFQWRATQSGSALWQEIDISSSAPQSGDCLCISHLQQLSGPWQALIYICSAVTSSRLPGNARLFLTFYCTGHCELTLTILYFPIWHTQAFRNTNIHKWPVKVKRLLRTRGMCASISVCKYKYTLCMCSCVNMHLQIWTVWVSTSQCKEHRERM